VLIVQVSRVSRFSRSIVTRAGTEFECIQGYGIFNGPNDAASIEAIQSWNTDIVRVPLNEDCWLGINGSPEEYSGEIYQRAIVQFVELVNSYDFVVILGSFRALCALRACTGVYTTWFDV
jgi:hypothetical protein